MATLTGRVVDQFGNPFQNFHVRVETVGTRGTSGVTPDAVWYQFPFMNEEGEFQLREMPPGDYRVRAIPFDRHLYDLPRSKDVPVTLSRSRPRGVLI